ncbi:isochorismatase family cysteine hydrolase [uncultured Clostridium sp.]|mgnify:CR=1 FL=1|uniref:isochorismatase family cysteine hydrolase n=1 Tax=uncultured Clostridium sp. TaxID=59620 RepID=UPI0025DE19CD|nr:isochorismatase family cysteine hydrolase [uncultured Clostridium sp.]
MKKALLVIDAQDDFIGEQRSKKKFDYENDIDDTIGNINESIASYYERHDEVIYVAHVLPSSYINRKFIGYGIAGSEGAKISEKIKIVSENYFEKQSTNSFKNNNLVRFIKENDISEIEIVGCDACGAVSATAKGGVELGLKVSVLRSATAAVNEEKFIKLRRKLKGFGVAYI